MDRDSLICGYFEAEFKYKDIVYILKQEYGILISERHLKRILKRNLLSRRDYTNANDEVYFIGHELGKSGQLHGYRVMYQRCLHAGYRVRVNDVRVILRQLDPEGVETRLARRLRRRSYFAQGPNYIWHIDGYDKLKPFGLCVHGSICGFSRKIVWLNAYHTNYDPRVIESYFLEAVKDVGGCPKIVRGDAGTGNVDVRRLQQFFRRNGRDPQRERCYIEGASTANQRIESWWGFLRREFLHLWIEMFRNLQDEGDYCGDFLDKNLVRFCFMSAFQDELDMAKAIWNSHTIRPSRNVNVPSGRPNDMYYVPGLWGCQDHVCSVPEADLRACWKHAEFRSVKPCDAGVYDVCINMTRRDNLEIPRHIWEARDFYLHLRHEILQLLL